MKGCNWCINGRLKMNGVCVWGMGLQGLERTQMERWGNARQSLADGACIGYMAASQDMCFVKYCDF